MRSRRIGLGGTKTGWVQDRAGTDLESDCDHRPLYDRAAASKVQASAESERKDRVSELSDYGAGRLAKVRLAVLTELDSGVVHIERGVDAGYPQSPP